MDEDEDDVSSLDTTTNNNNNTHVLEHHVKQRSFNVFNPRSPENNSKDDHSNTSHNTERQSLLEKDVTKDMHGRLLREKVMRNHKYYYSALSSFHIWAIVLVSSLDHLLRKYFEYFSYFLCTSFVGVTFYEIGWSVAALDFAAIFASSFVFPFIISRFSPHFAQFVCEVLIGVSMLFVVWWDTLVGLFVLRFVFGMCYILLLSNWSQCIATFVSPSKQSSAIGRIDLSWSFASFFFILCAYVMDHYGVEYIFYILGALAIVSSVLLFSIMPSEKLIHTEVHSHNFVPHLVSMLRLSLFCQHLPTSMFLVIIGIITFVNSTLTLLLAPWLSTDYDLSITEFGYCTVIIGTAQLVAILFSYQFANKLGVGWSLLAGILVQSIAFVLIFLLNNNGILYQYILYGSSSSDQHYTFPLLLILLILAIHFIAAEFTYINAVTCMLHIAPLNIISSKTVAANSMRFITSISRILGAIFAPYIWYNSVVVQGVDDEEQTIGSFQLFTMIAVILLGIAFVAHLALMLYITCCVWEKNKEDEQYMVGSSSGGNVFNDAQSTNTEREMYLFQNDKDYPNIRGDDDEEMDDEYIAKILSTNIDFTFI